MKTFKNYQTLFKRTGQIIAFVGAILLTTAFTLKISTITSASTVAFCFIIIVLLSAFFGNILVAVITSIVATLCFDYFYLPPFGTLNIAAFSDWISLTAFLLTSVIISYLTASASDNTEKANNIGDALIRMKEFGKQLMLIPNDQLTLSKIAEDALRIFSLEYCSIHVYGEGKWRHFTGAAASSDISKTIETHLNTHQDHTTDLMEIVDENMLGVQYMKISEDAGHQVLFVVKTRTLSTDTIGVIASMLSVRIMEFMKNKNS
jgi:K+-sensing histidine kinase KdpD